MTARSDRPEPLPAKEGGPHPWVDLAAERVGGWVLVASDEFFAPKENLLKPGRGLFLEGKYTDRGKWMDGWESRRRRGSGHDWCIVRLGLPGSIRRITVDTNHFRGNHPEFCSLDARAVPEAAGGDELADLEEGWVELVGRSPLEAHAENVFPVDDDRRWTHLRLNIYPDGGVARLRVHGRARPDWERLLSTGGPVDLVAVENGGCVLDSSDRFFGEPLNLLLPGGAADMREGWETRRRRGPGHDWVVLELGHRGIIEGVEVDTSHFKGNQPESFRLEGVDAAALDVEGTGARSAARGDPTEASNRSSGEARGWDELTWREIVGRTGLRPHARQRFRAQLDDPFRYVRFSIHPDGGVSRLRLWGRPLLQGGSGSDG